jgi:hypothetical protein
MLLNLIDLPARSRRLNNDVSPLVIERIIK